MSKDMFDFFICFLFSYDGNGKCDKAGNDDDGSDIDNDKDDKDDSNNNNNKTRYDGHVDIGNEEEEVDANNASDDTDAYNHALEEFGQNTVDDADANVDVEEGNYATGVTSTVVAEAWYKKVSNWIEFVNEQAQVIVNELSNVLSINEIVKLFKGHHSQMHIMKQKPLKKFQILGLIQPCPLLCS